MLYKTIVEKLIRYRLVLIAFIAMVIFVKLVHFNGLYGQDSYEYLRYTRSLKLFITKQINPGDFFWPVIYPIFGAVLSFILAPAFALQLVSIASFLVAAIYVRKTVMYLYNAPDRIADVYTLLFFLFSPYMLRASFVVMSDSLCLFFLTSSFYYFLRYQKSLTNVDFLLFVKLGAAAITTRYTAFVLLVIPICIALYHFFKNFNLKTFLIAIAVIGILSTPHFLIRYHHPFGFVHNDWLKDWSVANFIKSSFITSDAGNCNYPFWNILYVFFNFFHPAFCVAGLAFILFGIGYFKKNWNSNITIICLCVMVHALFLAGIPFQNLRFLQLSYAMACVLLFPGLLSIYNYAENHKLNKGTIVIAVIVLLIQLGLFYRVFMPFYHDNQNEKQIAKVILKYPHETIYTFSIDGALRAYGVDNDIIDLYAIKLDTMKLAEGKKLILFNEPAFSQAFNGKNVMNNYNYLKKNLKLTKVESLPDNWCLWQAYDN